MNSIEELLRIIRDKPTMYIGGYSISNLKAFIDGWCFRDSKTVADYSVLLDFQRWIEGRYRIKTAQSWSQILLFFSSDESAALQLFFKEFELFLSERKTPPA